MARPVFFTRQTCRCGAPAALQLEVALVLHGRRAAVGARNRRAGEQGERRDGGEGDFLDHGRSSFRGWDRHLGFQVTLVKDFALQDLACDAGVAHPHKKARETRHTLSFFLKYPGWGGSKPKISTWERTRVRLTFGRSGSRKPASGGESRRTC